jgi:hypothetical protein
MYFPNLIIFFRKFENGNLMRDGYNFLRLKTAILELSAATDWEVARREWRLVGVFESEEPETCLCGHHPIIEICEISNASTNRTAEVGNRCVKRFLGFRSDQIFLSLKKIRKDSTKSLGSDAVAFFYEKNIINQWEYSFQQDTMRKRNLTHNQVLTRQKINAKVLASLRRRGVN